METVITYNQDVNDIMEEVLHCHNLFAKDYDRIADEYEGGNVPKKLYDFCRKNFQYIVEEEADQTVCSPAVLLQRGHCDCKGYAGFIAGILDALNRADKGAYDWTYRFGYYENDSDCWHVFVVIDNHDGTETWIDPVLSSFNTRHPFPIEFIDSIPESMLTRMSGPGTAAPRPRPQPPVRSDYSPLMGYATIGTQAFTADQLGIPIGQKTFNLQNLTPGAAQAIAQNPPYRFYDGNIQIPLPPVVVPGATIPQLPANLRIVWADSFMGVPIPRDMLNVANNNGSLIIWPREIMSAGGTTDATNNLLWGNNKVLAFLMMAVLENLIYSFSPHPWGNTYADLGDYLHNHRDYDNWLRYPYEDRGTFFQEALKVGTQTYETVFLKPTSAVINTIIPGAGTAGAALETGLLNNLSGQSNAGNPQAQLQQPTTAPVAQVALQTPSTSQTILSIAKANPLLTLGMLAAVGLFIYELTRKK